MSFLRSSADQTLVRLLRARAESDRAFRESLNRIVTAEAKYEDYVQRKRREGAPGWMSRGDWESYVFGKDRAPTAPEEAAPPPQEDTRTKRVVQKMRDRKRQKKLDKLWGIAGAQSKPKRLFSRSDTKDLPRWAAQSSGNRDRILAQADEAQPLMLDWLDRGNGIDKAIGARTIRRDENPDAEIDFDEPGPVIVIAPRKTQKAAEDKVRERYGGDWQEGAVDLVRATIAVDKYEDLQDVVEKLKESGIELVSQPRNRFRDATAAGYRDIVLNTRLPNGHIMELQLHLKPILQAKDKNHQFYSEIKGLDEKVREAQEIDAEQQRLLDENLMQMRRNYDLAWSQAVSGSASIFDAPLITPRTRRRPSAPSRKKKAATGVLYFDMDGLPVRWEQPKLPQIHGGSKVYPIDSLAVFAERAVPIAEDEFNTLVHEREKHRDGGAEKDEDGKKAHDRRLMEAMWRRASTDPEFRRALQKAMREREEES